MKKLLRRIAPACIALALCAIPTFTVANAGKSDVNVADKTSITDQLDKGTWRIAGNVKSVNDSVVFDGDCSPNARITTRNVFKDCSADGINEIYTSSYTLTISDIPSGEDKRFAFSYGLEKIAGELGEKGTSEVYFINGGNDVLKVGVCKFDKESGAKTDIVAPTDYPSLAFGSSFTLNVSLVADGYMTVTIAPAGVSVPYVLCDDSTKGNTDHSDSGRVCIGQTDVCEATISSVKIKSYDYTNAATPIELTESFDNDEYNGNAFYTRSDPNDGTNLSGGVKIENGALTFTGRPCFISTVYSYSNFEMTFDLTDVTRKTVKDADGNVVKEKASGWLGFSLEASTGRGAFDNHARTNVLYTMEVEGKISRLYNQLNSNPKMQEYPAAYKTVEMDILSEKNEGKVYNYKVSMHDGVFSVWYKLSDSENYPSEPLFSKDLGYTPYGSVAIMAYGYCGYTFDNIKIVNKDIHPQKVEIEYSGVKNRTEPDFSYEDKWSDGDLITNKIGKTTSGKSGCGAALGGFTVLPILGAIAFAKRRKDHE